MPRVTFSECRACPVQYTCTAWHPEGYWEHDEGIDECIVVGDDEE